MQQWEYLQAKIESREWKDSTGRQAQLDETAGFYDASRLLTDLGSQGWELIGTAGDASNWYTLFFKRPKQE